jgi:hypothetical protein
MNLMNLDQMNLDHIIIAAPFLSPFGPPHPARSSWRPWGA